MERNKEIELDTGFFGLRPGGCLVCLRDEGDIAGDFAESLAGGLLNLAGKSLKNQQQETADVRYWRIVAEAFLRELCHLPEGTGQALEILPPDEAQISEWLLNAPPMVGSEYLTRETFLDLWESFSIWTRERLQSLGSIAAFLEEVAPAWSRVGRVTVHLAENKGDTDYPFAFMATYASGVGASGRLQTVPLAKALQEYSGAGNKAVLLKLLEPLHRASQHCSMMAEMVESGDVFHPMAWTPAEAFTFLQSVPTYEDAGLMVRIPDWWRKRGRRPKVTALIGDQSKGKLGLDALLDFKLKVEVRGESLTPDEIETLLQGEEGLVLFRGQWIEVDRQKLQEALNHWKRLEADGGVSFVEGMRLLAGASTQLNEVLDADENLSWAFAEAGEGLAETLRQLNQRVRGTPPARLQASLRPYQAEGLEWLWFCAQMGLGACLADDMGLGKTLQVLAALSRKQEAQPDSPPSLLVVPASLIGNWKREAARFAPDLRLFIAHRSETPESEFSNPCDATLRHTDLVITTYGMLLRLAWPTRTKWSWVIIDEAQAIKNPGSQQSKAVRKLKADARIAMTGTPIENHLGDLWSIFDFINPGLLGTASRFKTFTRTLQSQGQVHYAPLRRLIAPYILRRLKTDKSIIADLPDKTEMKVYCGLSTTQARLYAQTAKQLERELAQKDGIQRKGLVLAYLMRFKQICNHPDQLTRSGDYAPQESAKFVRLAEICAEIASRGEKVLIFTQFQEMTSPLENHLATVFGGRGLVLHGGTPVKERSRLVEQFHREDPRGPSFFVLSIKAGGTGLNLTAASHVIHFDRWWNPAIENQATDRAFRIGQKRNVIVHKFVTSGTLEEKIDGLLSGKQETAEAILSGKAEKTLTEMNDRELLDFIRLDLKHADTFS